MSAEECHLPKEWKRSPVICRRLIQKVLEEGSAPGHLQYINHIVVWGSTAHEVGSKGKWIVGILLSVYYYSKYCKLLLNSFT